MTRLSTASFEPEFIEGLRDIFERKVPFNHLLGLRITTLDPDRVACRIEMKDELTGHYSRGLLHGGVISAAIDAIGGLAVVAAVAARHSDEPALKRLERFGKVSTIDMRVDYLRPPISLHFDLRAQVLRLGSRVASTRMEFFGADGKLLASGAGAYHVA